MDLENFLQIFFVGLLPVEFMDHWWISESSHDHSLFFQLFGDILSRWTRNIDPCLNANINMLSNSKKIDILFSYTVDLRTHHWEESAGTEHENDIKNSVHWVSNNSLPRFWWWKIIAETSGWVGSSWSTFRLKHLLENCWKCGLDKCNGLWTNTYSIPNAQKRNEKVSRESCWQHLWDDIQVGDEGGLENNWDVWSVKQLDWVGWVLTSVSDRLDW